MSTVIYEMPENPAEMAIDTTVKISIIESGDIDMHNQTIAGRRRIKSYANAYGAVARDKTRVIGNHI